MKILIWQWGKRGGGPRFALDLLRGFQAQGQHDILLSLSRQSEIYDPATLPIAIPVSTYTSLTGFLRRIAQSPLLFVTLRRALRRLKPHLAICAMPGPLDLIMLVACKSLKIPTLVFIHDADAHPGDGYPFQMALQNRLIHHADMLAVLSRHVAGHLTGTRPPPFLATLPPSFYDHSFPPIFSHQGPMRLLFFGRLLHYKGLDLLADAIALLTASTPFTMRIVGSGPPSETLQRLQQDSRVQVENRWVPETEIPSLIAWTDALVLPYREASQSGVAGAAIAANRATIATRVGGLTEQLASHPGTLFCAPTAQDIARAITHMLNHPPTAIPLYDPTQDWIALVNRLVAYTKSQAP